MSDFHVRPYEPGDEQGQLDLFNRVFGEGNPRFRPRTMDEWRHLYIANPRGQQTFVGTDEGGAIIANYSSCPVLIAVHGEQRTATQVVDSCVDARWRRRLSKRGLFVSIAMAYQAAYCDNTQARYNEFIYGLPNENAFPIGTRLLGYTPIFCPMPRRFAALERPWIETLAARSRGVVAQEADWRSLPELARLWAAHGHELPLGLWKDEPYLAWRYRDWPGRPYRVVLARRGGVVVGAAVFRIHVEWEDHPIVPVVDWFGPAADEEVVAALLAAIASTAAAAGESRLETWATPPMPLDGVLARLGFGLEPSRFNLCMVLFSKDLTIEEVKRTWWLTMGDSDLY